MPRIATTHARRPRAAALLALAAGGSVLLAAQAGAGTARTRVTDAQGTRFEVAFDWARNTATAVLADNPAGLTGAALAERLQVAVWYGTYPGCRIRGAEGRDPARGPVAGPVDCR